jgi:peptide/nickel transport system ATP-binding protein
MSASTSGLASLDAPLVQARGLSKHFDATTAPWWQRAAGRGARRVLRAVDGVSFDIARGRTLGLVGESGCGKSTVARLLVGLYAPDAGEVRLDGADLHASLRGREAARVRRRLQMVFQDPYASLNPRWSVRDIVAEPLVEHGLLRRGPACDERVAELLQSVGLNAADRFKHPHQFSGGQRQRIAIARALAASPDFVVCDEPTSALDVSVQAQVLNLMRELQRARGLSYLFISHNLAVVRQVSDEVAVMYRGRIVEQADTATLFQAPRHPYTRLLLQAIPDMARAGQDPPCATAVEAPPEAASWNAGCAFHPRCPHANARCRGESPALRLADGTGRCLIRVACHAVEEGRS